MDVARLNFSHGDHAEHGRRFHEVRRAAEAAGRNIAVLADLQGPKIRLGRFADGPVEWRTGERVRITIEDFEGTHDRVSTTYKHLADDVRPGDRLLVDDGNVALVAVEIENGTDVVCDVTEGGRVSNNKGLSLPGVAVSVPAMSDKDADDLEFALRLGVDFVALSFVRAPEDVKLVQQVMNSVGVHRPVIAKIEKPEAVERLDDIVLAFDGVMIARGDLGVELPLEQVPIVQKRAIQICRDNAKPVIVATQMLESMISHSRPTRAEASDVANAVLDGADAVMLSGETSVGKYPVQTVATMSRIITSVESSGVAGARTSAQAPHVRGRDRQGGQGHRRRARRGRVRRVHPDRRHHPPTGPTASGAAAPRFHPGRERASPNGPAVGRRGAPGVDGQHHRRHGAPGRLGPRPAQCVPPRRPCRRRCRHAADDAWCDQHHPGPSHRRRPQGDR